MTINPKSGHCPVPADTEALTLTVWSLSMETPHIRVIGKWNLSFAGWGGGWMESPGVS